MISSLRRVWRDLIGPDKPVPMPKLIFSSLEKILTQQPRTVNRDSLRPHIFFVIRNKQ
jgi:hypothetical protein